MCCGFSSTDWVSVWTNLTLRGEQCSTDYTSINQTSPPPLIHKCIHTIGDLITKQQNGGIGPDAFNFIPWPS
jgi:hypothetical protein